MGRWGITPSLPTLLFAPPACAFLPKAMSRPNFFNSKVVYHDNSREYNIDARGRDLTSILHACEAEDITPVQEVEPAETIDSIIFTKKAKQEHKEAYIIAALQKSVQGRKDKTRAFVQELQGWQKDEYVDAHYNARVMYDELDKLIPLSFGYEVFKKYYNNTI